MPSQTNSRDFARRTVHLVNPLWDPTGGADLRTIDLHALLGREQPASLWSEYRVDPAFRHLPVQRIRPWRFPMSGTVVLVGVYFRTGHWVRWSGAHRVVVIYNTAQPDRLEKTLCRIGNRPVQMVYTSEALREATLGEPQLARRRREVLESGVVLESFVDPASFAAVFAGRSHKPADPGSEAFTVGRLSRDSPRKHHPNDPGFFAALARLGMRVRVMGGASLRESMGSDPNVELLPAGAMPSAQFLSTLDAFYYRTHPGYFEAFGRVVLEAMLCGIPVVAEARGGYARHIRHGENGFLFDDPREALGWLNVLRKDHGLRARIGHAAHVSAFRFFSEDLPRRTRKALLSGLDSRTLLA